MPCIAIIHSFSGSTMEARSTFIRSKYCDRRYAIQTTASSDGGEEVEALGEDLLHDLKSAVIAKDVSGLLQCLAERLDLFSPLIATVSLGFVGDYAVSDC